MLYPTHKKYGILWGLLMIPVAVLIGLIPIVTMDMRNGDLLLIMLACYMGMRGALFGARFPDIDSPGSIPARRHPHIRKVFAFFNIKHRGKFSHDYISIGVVFILLYQVVSVSGVRLLEVVSEGNGFIITGVYLATIVFVYMVGLDIVGFFQWVANKMKNKRMWVILEKRRFLIALTNVVWLIAVLVIGGFVDIQEIVRGNVSMASALMSGTVLVVSFKVYVLFAWAGAYSHLFADMTTKSGVSIFGMKVAPAQVVLKIKKIPVIGRLLVPTEFKTGSQWENYNRAVITGLCVPACILAFMVLTGFNIPEFIDTVKNMKELAGE